MVEWRLVQIRPNADGIAIKNEVTMRLRHGHQSFAATCVYGMTSLDFCIRHCSAKVKYCRRKSGPLPDEARMR